MPRVSWIPLSICLAALVACEGSKTPRDAGSLPDGALRCATGSDPDGDLIDRTDEGEDDPDGDGAPSWDDPDADGDGWADRLEAGDTDCTTNPVDTDLDGVPDFLDRDAAGDGVDDAGQGGDTDGDGIADWRDLDVDGDGIDNPTEVGPDGRPVDTDGDGIDDAFDLDSDGDTILDEHEGPLDVDRDGVANFRDLDSDGDGVRDRTEAGDTDLDTPPAVCAVEIDPVTGEIASDDFADFVDADSDNDGLGDGDEADLGTDPCRVDTDGDGIDDLAEGAYQRVNCPDGETGRDCRCATDPACTIPTSYFYLILPFGAPAVSRDLDFSTTIRAADVFFLADTTSSMVGTLNNVQTTVGRPSTGLIDRIAMVIDDAWFGGGAHDDFPFSPHGGGADEPFVLAIGATPPTLPGMAAGSGRDAVATAFGALAIHSGGDPPESHTEALHQIVTGEGGSWMGSGGRTYTMRRWQGDCLGRGWGAACFRDDALAIVVHFSDVCAHGGPPGESGTCAGYTTITPGPAAWGTTTTAMLARGVRYVGINTTTESCVGTVGAAGTSPCWFMTETARATGSVALDGAPLVFDLPDGSGSTVFVDTVVGAIRTVITRVPMDVDTAVRDDPTDSEGIDATRFIRSVTPACRATPPTTPCFTAPAGVDDADAVASIDDAGFAGVIPETTVRFRVTFQNDFVPSETGARVFVAFIDVRGDGSAVLDTRQVFVVVPAVSRPAPI